MDFILNNRKNGITRYRSYGILLPLGGNPYTPDDARRSPGGRAGLSEVLEKRFGFGEATGSVAAFAYGWSAIQFEIASSFVRGFSSRE